MAEQLEQIVIDVQFEVGDAAANLAKVTNQLAALKEQQAAMNKFVKEGGAMTAEQAKQYAENARQIKELTATQKALTGQLQTTQKQNKLLGDSFREMDAQLRNLENQYKSLSKEQRNTAEGKALRDAIIQQKQALKDFDEELGNFQRNVGNYENALKSVGGGFAQLGSKLKVFLANPWTAIIAAIVLAIKSLVDAFKRSEDRMNEMRSALAPLQGAVDLIKRGFDALAKVVANVVVKALEKALEGVRWIARQLDTIGGWLGKNWGLEQAFETAAENTEKLTALEIAYQQHRRNFIKEEAQQEQTIARLRNEVAQKDKYTAEERLKKLEEVTRREKALANERVKLAKEELAILQTQAARGENNAEMNDRLADAEANVTKAQTAYYDVTRRVEAQMAQLRAEIEGTTAAIVEQTTAVEENTAAFDDELEEYGKKRDAMLEKFGLKDGQSPAQKELQVLADALAQELITREEFELASTKIKEKYTKQRNEMTQQEVEKATALYETQVKRTMNATGAALEAMSELLGEYTESNTEAAKAQKAFAIGAVLVNEAMAIAEGAKAIAAAQAGAAEAAAATGPAAPVTFAAFTAEMVGAVISTIASVVASILEAKNILGGKFATGGVVGGTSYSGDRVTAQVNSGEMILNKEQQSRLFEIANGQSGAGFEMARAAMVAAFREMPAPILEYKEFKQFEKNVITYKEIAAI